MAKGNRHTKQRVEAPTTMPGMPTDASRRKWAAESFAHSMSETDPLVKRRQRAIARAALAAARRVTGGRGPSDSEE